MSGESTGKTALPKAFSAGQKLKASDLNQLREALAFALKDMIGGGTGITVTESAGRYLISAKRRQRDRKDAFPLQVIPFFDDPDWKVRVRYGTINNDEVPEIDGTELDPVFLDGPELTIDTSADGSRFVYLKVTISALFIITDLEILEAAALPADTSTEGHVTLDILEVSGGAIVDKNPQVKSNLAYAYQGGSSHLFIYGS